MILTDPRIDRIVVAIIAGLMTWVVFDMLTTEGLIPGLVFPVFFGIAPVVFVFVFRLPLLAFLFFLVWLLAMVGLYSGVFDGVTGLPLGRSNLSVSSTKSPVGFLMAMVVNLVVVCVGGFYAVRWLLSRHAR